MCSSYKRVMLTDDGGAIGRVVLAIQLCGARRRECCVRISTGIVTSWIVFVGATKSILQVAENQRHVQTLLPIFVFLVIGNRIERRFLRISSLRVCRPGDFAVVYAPFGVVFGCGSVVIGADK